MTIEARNDIVRITHLTGMIQYAYAVDWDESGGDYDRLVDDGLVYAPGDDGYDELRADFGGGE